LENYLIILKQYKQLSKRLNQHLAEWSIERQVKSQDAKKNKKFIANQKLIIKLDYLVNQQIEEDLSYDSTF